MTRASSTRRQDRSIGSRERPPFLRLAAAGRAARRPLRGHGRRTGPSTASRRPIRRRGGTDDDADRRAGALDDQPSEQGWYSGENHIHANYGYGHWYNSPRTMRVQCAGRTCGVANFMVANSDGDGVFDREYFRGRPDPLSTIIRCFTGTRSSAARSGVT